MSRRLVTFLTLACALLLSPLAEAKNGADDRSPHKSSGSDDHDNNRGGSDRSREVRARNSFVRGKFKVKSPLLKVRFERRVKVKRNKLDEDRLRAWVKVGVPYAAVNINNLDDAAAAVVVMSFLREGTEYANCTLTFDEIEEDDDSVSAEYRLDLRNRAKKSSLEVKKGSCDTDLTVPGSENTIPDVKAGDTLKVSINGVASLISGTVQ